MKKAIRNKEEVHREYLYFAFMSWQRAVRDDRFKLIEYCVDNKRYTQLFDLTMDPHELKNLAGNPDYMSRLDSLRVILKKERMQQNDGNTAFDFTNEQGIEFWSTYEKDGKSEFPEFDFSRL